MRKMKADSLADLVTMAARLGLTPSGAEELSLDRTLVCTFSLPANACACRSRAGTGSRLAQAGRGNSRRLVIRALSPQAIPPGNEVWSVQFPPCARLSSVQTPVQETRASLASRSRAEDGRAPRIPSRDTTSGWLRDRPEWEVPRAPTVGRVTAAGGGAASAWASSPERQAAR